VIDWVLSSSSSGQTWVRSVCFSVWNPPFAHIAERCFLFTFTLTILLFMPSTVFVSVDSLQCALVRNGENLRRLEALADVLPRERRFAFEFRHRSWFHEGPSCAVHSFCF